MNILSVDKPGKDKDPKTTLRLFVFMVTATFVVELSIMLILDSLSLKISNFEEALLDSFLLTAMLFPLLYLFFFGPFLRALRKSKETEALVRASEERYEALVETSPDCIKLFDLHGKLLYINKGGLDEHRLRNLEEAYKWDYLSGVIEEDRAKFQAAFKDAVLGRGSTIEIRHTVEGSVREACLETMAPVKDSNGEIVNIFGVSRDITEIKKLEKAKESLTQMIVHDLRNPLNIAMQDVYFLQKSLKDSLSEQDQNMFLIFFTKLAEMRSMISNLLSISKMEEGKLALKYESINIADLINEITNDMKIAAGTKEISAEISSDLTRLNADRDIIKRVISNLIGNALKFTPAGSCVKVLVNDDKKNKSVVISVKDQGEGIPEEYKYKIFDKFFQVHDKKVTKNIGEGLGLAFCKMAVEAHGGNIWVESKVGEGSTFYFTMPVK